MSTKENHRKRSHRSWNRHFAQGKILRYQTAKRSEHRQLMQSMQSGLLGRFRSKILPQKVKLNAGEVSDE